MDRFLFELCYFGLVLFAGTQMLYRALDFLAEYDMPGLEMLTLILFAMAFGFGLIDFTLRHLGRHG